jgi:C4-dicarboxylate-specific signal transduction histidine kinase
MVRAALVHYGFFLIPAVAFMIAGILLIRSGLSPMKQLRSRLAAVHNGSQRRVGGQYPTEVKPLVDDLNLLLDRREEALRRAIAKAGDLAQREDLDEMIGNLRDNACKWANARVTVSSEKYNSTIVVLIDDDGPGLPPSLREKVLHRGVRADEAAPGSGFALAIVRDVAALYAGRLTEN